MLSTSFYCPSISNVTSTVLLFGSVGRIAINLRIKVTNASTYFVMMESSVVVRRCIIICKSKIQNNVYFDVGK